MTRPWSADWKARQLEILFAEWGACDRCALHKTRKNVVFGNGNPDADVVFVGQGPGEQEDEDGEPFVGPSGDLLDALLTAVGLPRPQVFATNLVMCFPPSNRVPTRDEREACWPRLARQLYLVDPVLIIPVGKYAMKSLMGGAWQGISSLHGHFGEATIPGLYEKDLKYPAMPVFHPSYILRSDQIDRDTGHWPEGGPAHQTFVDLTHALEVVKELKKRHKESRAHAKTGRLPVFTG